MQTRCIYKIDRYKKRTSAIVLMAEQKPEAEPPMVIQLHAPVQICFSSISCLPPQVFQDTPINDKTQGLCHKTCDS